MDWEKLLITYRHESKDDESALSGRSHFNMDIDRIIFSSAFRRLGKKTQVHPLSQNDHIHTRLTHSLEVASVGRTLGLIIGKEVSDELPSGIDARNIAEIVAAACLAHDIGNPPFGHAGESAIRSWFKGKEGEDILKDLKPAEKNDLLSFEGNAASFRLVSKVCYYHYAGGMRLTYPTLASMMKYPWDSTKAHALCEGDKVKFSCYHSEVDILNDIGEKLELPKKGDNHWARHPLSHLVEAADDICYSILDLEDALELNIVSLEEVVQKIEGMFSFYPQANTILSSEIPDRRKMSYIRGRYIRTAIDDCAKAFRTKYEDIMQGSLKGDLIENSDLRTKSGVAEAKKLANKIFKVNRKVELEIGAYSTLSILLESIITAIYQKSTKDRGKIEFKETRIIDLLGTNAPNADDNLHESYMKALDYIGGMTDNYATYIAGQIRGMAR